MYVRLQHNMEIAHRLSKDDGKCKQIHGHGMQVMLTIHGQVDPKTNMTLNNDGDKFEFGAMKKKFRTFIDETFDHRLILNVTDPFAQPIYMIEHIPQGEVYMEIELQDKQVWLPGLQTIDGDPTIENLAIIIGKWAAETFKTYIKCNIEETRTNGCEVEVLWNGFEAKVIK